MPRSCVPSYPLHKPSGQAVVTVRAATGERRDAYLGTYDSPESRREYARIVAELATGPAAPVSPARASGPGLTVDQVLLAFWEHAQNHYRGPEGKPTTEVEELRRSVIPLRKLYGHTPAAEFGPRALAAVRQEMIAAGWCRSLINHRVDRVRRVFKWATAEELVPVTVYQSLRTLAGLQKGRTPVKAAILRGVGVAVLSLYAVREELRDGRLRAVDLDGLGCARDMFVVRDRRRWGVVRGRCTSRLPDHEGAVAGLWAPLLRRLPRHVPVRGRVRRQPRRPEVGGHGAGGAVGRGGGGRCVAAQPVRGSAQRHGPARLQAVVDAARPAARRAQHLRPCYEPRADPPVLAVATAAGRRLARRVPARRPAVGALRHRVGRGTGLDVPDRPLRPVRAAA
ncbi:MAG: hypothetical protein J0I06_27965, partial [Planctomycetes bacterium]|nr:hypothetical protein [Planctomycetota bacterium]